MVKRDMDQPQGGRERDVNDTPDDASVGRGDEAVRGIADEESDEFEDTEDVDEEETDEEDM